MLFAAASAPSGVANARNTTMPQAYSITLSVISSCATVTLPADGGRACSQPIKNNRPTSADKGNEEQPVALKWEKNFMITMLRRIP